VTLLVQLSLLPRHTDPATLRSATTATMVLEGGATSHNTMECRGKQNKDARDEGLGGQARVVMTTLEATLLDLNSNGSVYNASTITCIVAGHYLIDLGASHHIVGECTFIFCDAPYLASAQHCWEWSSDLLVCPRNAPIGSCHLQECLACPWY
jgi:hypothetical protein